MGATTNIEWTDATWNPILGCSRVSEGCRHCYAESIAGRFGGGEKTVYSGLTRIVNGHAQWTGVIKETKQLLAPLKWKEPKRVFVNSMSDLFHENVSDELRDRIFAVMFACGRHAFQVLTKRPKMMLEYFSPDNPRYTARKIADAACAMGISRHVFDCDVYFPLANVWLGVSIENQAAAEERIPLLLQTPAVARFISAEPLLGPVDLRKLVLSGPSFFFPRECSLDALSVWIDGKRGLDWVICGGESGPHARPMHPHWARTLRDECAAAGVPFFFKQWGDWTPGENVSAHAGVFDAARWIGHWCFNKEDIAHRLVRFEDDAPDLYRVGKIAAGALLDGREHREFPASPEVPA